MKALNYSASREKGTWKPTADGSATVSCPGCGVTMHLQHGIDSEGTVTPSLVCPRSGCGFHDYVVLIDWQRFREQRFREQHVRER